MDYTMWSVMQEKATNIEFRECIMSAWDELDQRAIDTAGRQWRTRPPACIRRKTVTLNAAYCTLINSD